MAGERGYTVKKVPILCMGDKVVCYISGKASRTLVV